MMKILFSILFIFFSSPIIADSISDFQIEGISIGDSALNFLNRSEIIKQTKMNSSHYSYLKKPNEFGEVYILENDKFDIYDGLSFFVKQDDNNFEIRMLRGLIWLDINSCLSQREKIRNEIEGIIENFEKEEITFNAHQDELSESKMHNINYYLPSGDVITLQCTDWSKRMKKEYN